MIIHISEEIRCTRRRVPSSFSRKEEIRPLCGAKGVDCSERKRLPQRDTNKAFRLPSRAHAPARRKRTATVSLFVSTQMFCCPAWPGQKAALYASVRETNRRPFGARCGGYACVPPTLPAGRFRPYDPAVTVCSNHVRPGVVHAARFARADGIDIWTANNKMES